MKSIYVSIASYRDRLCSATLQSMFRHARHPHRVFVGVCLQNNATDDSCHHPHPNIRYLHVPASRAKGPAYARYLCSTMYRGEDFFFQIDSHCLFVQDWDEKLIRMILSTKNPRAILSHYPKRYEDYEPNPDPSSNVTIIKRAFLNKNGIITFHGAEHASPPPTPDRAYFIAAGFLFVSGAFLKEVPFDPNLDHLFAGEEILLTIRAYTNGWDVYTPNLDILYHKYTRKNEPKFWDYYTYKAPTEAEKKVKTLTHPTATATATADAADQYGLGNIRTVREFYQSAPIDSPRRWWWHFVVVLTIAVVALYAMLLYSSS